MMENPKWRPAVQPGEEAETDNFAKANPVDVGELRARINEVVPTKDGQQPLIGNKPPAFLKLRRLHNVIQVTI